MVNRPDESVDETGGVARAQRGVSGEANDAGLLSSERARTNLTFLYMGKKRVLSPGVPTATVGGRPGVPCA